MRLRLIALVLLVIAGTAAGFVLTRVDSSRDAWLVFGTGLALAAVTGALALTRNRQRQATLEVERYFALAPEMVILAEFDGYWKRVNPTAEALLGYTERDWRARPFVEFIHPDDLREVSRGIHPTILTEAGLGPALRALARRSNVPIDVDVRLDERLPTPVEAAACYIASEALTNVAKHAHANVVQLTAAHDNGVLTLEVRDDGVGGVDAGRGFGILGLTDRVEALGGTISITSPPGAATTLTVRLPIATYSSGAAPAL